MLFRSAPAASAPAADIRHWLQAASARFPNVQMLDLNTHICPSGLCRAELDGRVVYRDNQHLSGSFAGSLAQRVSDALQWEPKAATAAPGTAASPASASQGIPGVEH